MARIVAGLFEHQQAADAAIASLRDGAGIDAAAITSFVVNPPGMHAGTPIGGDVDADAQARGGEEGAVRGAAIGGAAGVAAGLLAAPLVGPVGFAAGIGAGAFVGSLAGAASSMGDDAGGEGGGSDQVTARPGGIIVAVNTELAPEAAAIASLKASGANLVEIADGDWANGEWRDFDALNPPRDVVAVRGNPNYPT